MVLKHSAVTNISRLGFIKHTKQMLSCKIIPRRLHCNSNGATRIWGIFETLRISPRKSLPDKQESHSVLYSRGILSQSSPLRRQSSFSSPSPSSVVYIWVGVKEMCCRDQMETGSNSKGEGELIRKQNYR